MKRVLKLKWFGEAEKWMARVVEQSHRNNILTPTGDRYVAKNGITLLSVHCPNNAFPYIYIRGQYKREDDCFLGHFDDYQRQKTEEAVAEYNATNGGENSGGNVTFIDGPPRSIPGRIEFNVDANVEQKVENQSPWFVKMGIPDLPKDHPEYRSSMVAIALEYHKIVDRLTQKLARKHPAKYCDGCRSLRFLTRIPLAGNPMRFMVTYVHFQSCDQKPTHEIVWQGTTEDAIREIEQ